MCYNHYNMWFKFLQKFVRFIDPKLEKYRIKRPSAKPKPTEQIPTTTEDFIKLIRHTPESVLTKTDRARIAAVMSYDDKIISDLMLPRSKMVFVRDTELIGPLVLDKLFKSGLIHFPVKDDREKIIGILHTESLNTLEERNIDTARRFADPHFGVIHTTDPLDVLVREVKQNGYYYFLVHDPSDRLVGSITTDTLLGYLLSE